MGETVGFFGPGYAARNWAARVPDEILRYVDTIFLYSHQQPETKKSEFESALHQQGHSKVPAVVNTDFNDTLRKSTMLFITAGRDEGNSNNPYSSSTLEQLKEQESDVLKAFSERKISNEDFLTYISQSIVAGWLQDLPTITVKALEFIQSKEVDGKPLLVDGDLSSLIQQNYPPAMTQEQRMPEMLAPNVSLALNYGQRIGEHLQSGGSLEGKLIASITNETTIIMNIIAAAVTAVKKVPPAKIDQFIERYVGVMDYDSYRATNLFFRKIANDPASNKGNLKILTVGTHNCPVPLVTKEDIYFANATIAERELERILASVGYFPESYFKLVEDGIKYWAEASQKRGQIIADIPVSISFDKIIKSVVENNHELFCNAYFQQGNTKPKGIFMGGVHRFSQRKIVGVDLPKVEVGQSLPRLLYMINTYATEELLKRFFENKHIQKVAHEMLGGELRRPEGGDLLEHPTGAVVPTIKTGGLEVEVRGNFSPDPVVKYTGFGPSLEGKRRVIPKGKLQSSALFSGLGENVRVVVPFRGYSLVGSGKEEPIFNFDHTVYSAYPHNGSVLLGWRGGVASKEYGRMGLSYSPSHREGRFYHLPGIDGIVVENETILCTDPREEGGLLKRNLTAEGSVLGYQAKGFYRRLKKFGGRMMMIEDNRKIIGLDGGTLFVLEGDDEISDYLIKPDEEPIIGTVQGSLWRGRQKLDMPELDAQHAIWSIADAGDGAIAFVTLGNPHDSSSVFNRARGGVLTYCMNDKKPVSHQGKQVCTDVWSLADNLYVRTEVGRYGALSRLTVDDSRLQLEIVPSLQVDHASPILYGG